MLKITEGIYKILGVSIKQLNIWRCFNRKRMSAESKILGQKENEIEYSVEL